MLIDVLCNSCCFVLFFSFCSANVWGCLVEQGNKEFVCGDNAILAINRIFFCGKSLPRCMAALIPKKEKIGIMLSIVQNQQICKHSFAAFEGTYCHFKLHYQMWLLARAHCKHLLSNSKTNFFLKPSIMGWKDFAITAFPANEK